MFITMQLGMDIILPASFGTGYMEQHGSNIMVQSLHAKQFIGKIIKHLMLIIILYTINDARAVVALMVVLEQLMW